MWTAAFVIVLVLTIVRKLRRGRRTRRLMASPLAGFDTGTRSPFRAPVAYRKGF